MDAIQDWDLGDGTDCETCGWSPEEAEGEFEDGVVTLILRVGRCGEDRYEGSPGSVLDEFRRDWPQGRRRAFDRPAAFESIEAWLRGLVLNEITRDATADGPTGDGFVETR